MFSQIRSAVLLAATVFGTAVFSTAQTAPPPAKVAVVNFAKAVADTADIKHQETVMTAKYRPRQDQLTQLQTDLNTIQQQLSAPGITPDREAQLRATGADKQRQLQRLNEDLQADFNAERQDILNRAGRQMTEVVKKVAEERGLDVVLDNQTTIYFRPALDITADATAAYDKAYPAAK